MFYYDELMIELILFSAIERLNNILNNHYSLRLSHRNGYLSSKPSKQHFFNLKFLHIFSYESLKRFSLMVIGSTISAGCPFIIHLVITHILV